MDKYTTTEEDIGFKILEKIENGYGNPMCIIEYAKHLFIKEFEEKYPNVPTEVIKQLLLLQEKVSLLESNLNYEENYNRCEHCGRQDEYPDRNVIIDSSYLKYQDEVKKAKDKIKETMEKYGHYEIDWISLSYTLGLNEIGQVISFK